MSNKKPIKNSILEENKTRQDNLANLLSDEVDSRIKMRNEIIQEMSLNQSNSTIRHQATVNQLGIERGKKERLMVAVESLNEQIGDYNKLITDYVSKKDDEIHSLEDQVATLSANHNKCRDNDVAEILKLRNEVVLLQEILSLKDIELAKLKNENQLADENVDSEVAEPENKLTAEGFLGEKISIGDWVMRVRKSQFNSNGLIIDSRDGIDNLSHEVVDIKRKAMGNVLLFSHHLDVNLHNTIGAVDASCYVITSDQ